MIRSDKFKPQKLRLSRRSENRPFTRKDELVLDIIMIMSIIVSFYNGRRTKYSYKVVLLVQKRQMIDNDT